MAYEMPKVVLTTKGHGGMPMRCPRCGKDLVVLYLATDVARCHGCYNAWHPSDAIFRERPAPKPLPVERPTAIPEPESAETEHPAVAVRNTV